jgi:hypothetical protein
MTDDLDIEVQIPHQPSNHLQLLVVFLAKDRDVGPNDIEKLCDHRGNALEVAGAVGRTQQEAQFVYAYLGLETRRINLVSQRVEQDIDTFPLEQFSIPSEVPRIGGEVFAGSELLRVHEYGDNDAICSLFPVAHETEVCLVEKTHGGNEDDAPTVTPLDFTPTAHLLNALNDLHGDNVELECWSIGVVE